MRFSNLVRGVHRNVEEFIAQRIKAVGLSVEQYRILEALTQTDGRSMGSLAAVVFVDSPTLTKIVDRMVSSGLVYRAPDANDRRKVLIYRARRGAQIFESLSGVEAELQAELARVLGDEGLERLTAGLKRLLDGVEAVPANPVSQGTAQGARAFDG
ncbi:MarR family transcriptional regulator [Defluviimonas sp. 20V17]|uniref:Transcriptional regulator n=1 Tax=Allgaiera indica TaxID=765699 RepID=A0AAN4UQG5_9RHOB|nr:MarR family winged helix-turn-helix transcriptional regulator [Allgaiera indica]KDB02787.1 MarR family transcriptional regulator [Defluviimonas sp. 20V17]GHE01178.1 transcriptional regulator [Allgaiera indica]SDW82117.1 transcriptional regulator, MarR family [Allgaiera indica]